MQKIMILGATGSVGSSTLELLEMQEFKELFQVETLVGGSNTQKLAEQSLKHKPKYSVIYDESKYGELKDLLFGSGIEVLAGRNALLDVVKNQHDLTIAAISGIAGLEPIYRCIPNTRKIAIANKESIVCAGSIILSLAEKHSTKIIPIDSEHSAIFQILNSGASNQSKQMEKITLTASGGPFLNKSMEELAKVTPKEAVKHPNWSMGAKISVDSATLMNKGLEVIEAALLFDLPSSKIEVLVHPESILHGMVHYKDGSTIAHMSVPDMKTAISLAFLYPERLEWHPKPLNLIEIGKLSFLQPDFQKFPLLNLAISALNEGPAACIILNAANEIAVNMFLSGKISFLEIIGFIRKVLEVAKRPNSVSLIEDIIGLDQHIRDMF